MLNAFKSYPRQHLVSCFLALFVLTSCGGLSRIQTPAPAPEGSATQFQESGDDQEKTHPLSEKIYDYDSEDAVWIYRVMRQSPLKVALSPDDRALYLLRTA